MGTHVLEQSFRPTEQFWSFIKANHERVELVECGTGTGALLEEAKRRGYRLLGNDISIPANASPLVVEADARTIEWSLKRWPIVCAPDHTGWVYDLFQIVKLTGAHGWYFGQQHNYIRDLDRTRTEKMPGVYGVDGENGWWVKPIGEKKHTSGNGYSAWYLSKEKEDEDGWS